MQKGRSAEHWFKKGSKLGAEENRVARSGGVKKGRGAEWQCKIGSDRVAIFTPGRAPLKKYIMDLRFCLTNYITWFKFLSFELHRYAGFNLSYDALRLYFRITLRWLRHVLFVIHPIHVIYLYNYADYAQSVEWTGAPKSTPIGAPIGVPNVLHRPHPLLGANTVGI